MMIMMMTIIVITITDFIELEKSTFKINQNSNFVLECKYCTVPAAVIKNNYYLGHRMIFFSEIQVKYRLM